MRRLRGLGLAYLGMATIGCAITIVHSSQVVVTILDAIPYEDGAIAYLDHSFEIDPTARASPNLTWWQWLMVGGFRRLLINLLSIPLLYWLWRFIYGALEEIRITKRVTGLGAVKCFLRWLIVAYTSLVVPLLFALFLYYLLEYAPLNPIVRIATAGSFGTVLYVGSWYLPKLLLKQAQSKAEWLIHQSS